MPCTSTFPLADRLIGGGLAEWLQTKRDDGASYEDIAYELRSTHDITVSRSTVYRWCQEAAS